MSIENSNKTVARNEIRFSLNGIILLRSENALHLEGFLLGCFFRYTERPVNV